MAPIKEDIWFENCNIRSLLRPGLSLKQLQECVISSGSAGCHMGYGWHYTRWK